MADTEKRWLVGVQQRVRLPHRETDDTIERTFTVVAGTAKQAEKAVKDTGVVGLILPAIQEKHWYPLAETLDDAKERPTGNEPRRKPKTRKTTKRTKQTKSPTQVGRIRRYG